MQRDVSIGNGQLDKFSIQSKKWKKSEVDDDTFINIQPLNVGGTDQEHLQSLQTSDYLEAPQEDEDIAARHRFNVTPPTGDVAANASNFRSMIPELNKTVGESMMNDTAFNSVDYKTTPATSIIKNPNGDFLSRYEERKNQISQYNKV